MLIYSWVKSWNPQNISGILQQNSVAEFPQTAELDGDTNIDFTKAISSNTQLGLCTYFRRS